MENEPENEPEVPTFNPSAGSIGKKNEPDHTENTANTETASVAAIVTESMSTRPERIIAGEVREEAKPVDLLPTSPVADEPETEETQQNTETDRYYTETAPPVEPVEIVDLTAHENIPTEPIQIVETDINFTADETQEVTQETLENLPVDETPNKPLNLPEIDTEEALIPGEEKPNPGPIAIFKEAGIFFTLIWGLGIAALAGGAAYMFANAAFIPVTILGFLIGVIAAIDIKTHLIKDAHTITVAVIITPLTIWYALTAATPWNLLWGLGVSAIIFGVFLFLVWFTGFGSGGDIKFSPIPAFLLGTINPLVGLIWFFISLLVTALALSLSRKKQTAFGLGMALAVPTSITATYYLYQVAGMGMM